MKFTNGAHGLIQASAVAHRAGRVVDINALLHGDSGTLEVEHPFLGAEAGATLRGVHQDEAQFGRLAVPEELRKNLDEGEIFDPYIKQSAGPRLFIDAILEDRPVSLDFYDGHKVQQVIDTALESFRNSCWISLENN